MQICPQVQNFLINQSGYHTEFHSEKLGWENLVYHTAVLQQLLSKMPETHKTSDLTIKSSVFKQKHSIFDENRKSLFLICRLKIVALCIVTECQCDSFRAVGSYIVFQNQWFFSEVKGHGQCLYAFSLAGNKPHECWHFHSLHPPEAKLPEANPLSVFTVVSCRSQHVNIRCPSEGR